MKAINRLDWPWPAVLQCQSFVFVQLLLQGQANQLHKCIVTSSSGRGVFDGNVRVGRYAQRTDAGQLSRNLLLAPRATVNVKPNLQVCKDDCEVL